MENGYFGRKQQLLPHLSQSRRGGEGRKGHGGER